MPFIYETEEPEAKTPCCAADAATESGPCCDPVTGQTTAEPTKLCCDKAQKRADEGASSGCCG